MIKVLMSGDRQMSNGRSSASSMRRLGRTVDAAPVYIWIVNLHDAIRSGKWFETELRVQTMCVPSGKQHPAKTLEVGVLKDLFHETLRKTFAAVFGKDVNVGKVGESCLVGYDSSEADLLILVEDTET